MCKTNKETRASPNLPDVSHSLSEIRWDRSVKGLHKTSVNLSTNSFLAAAGSRGGEVLCSRAGEQVLVRAPSQHKAFGCGQLSGWSRSLVWRSSCHRLCPFTNVTSPLQLSHFNTHPELFHLFSSDDRYECSQTGKLCQVKMSDSLCRSAFMLTRTWKRREEVKQTQTSLK